MKLSSFTIFFLLKDYNKKNQIKYQIEKENKHNNKIDINKINIYCRKI